MSETQWWLATLDRHGNPTLCDGAHSHRAGADRAAYLVERLRLQLGRPSERYAVVRLEIYAPQPNADGVDEGAIDRLNAARGGSR